MLRACLDSNIWISGMTHSGTPSAVVSLALSRKFHVVTSSFILSEVERILINKFQINPKKARRFTQRIRQIGDVYEPSGIVSVITEDPTDNFVLETAWMGRARYLVSGDRHILPLKTFKNVKILDAASFYKVAAK